MIIIVYSDVNATNIHEKLGSPEYSYYYVLKEYLPVLRQLGVVVVVSNPAKEVDEVYHNALAHGQECVFLSFSPPHKTELNLDCPTIPVFAWEFDTIPTESWFDKPEHDWRVGLGQTAMAIVHSELTVNSVRQAMGDNFPVISVPAPVWDGCAQLTQKWIGQTRGLETVALKIKGTVVDTWDLDASLFAPTVEHPPIKSLVRDKYVAEKYPITLELSGLIYISVFNPNDGRKNWADLLSAFCEVHRDKPDVTLVIKLVHHKINWALCELLRFIYTITPFKCRIVFIHGYLPDEDYQRLMYAAHFVVNTSHGEGQCLPLMELLSLGKPALAPLHSSMLDYITPDNSFIIKSSAEPTHWQHDPRRASRTLRHRIDWSSACTAFSDSYRVFHEDFEQYQRMGIAAQEAQKNNCSHEIALTRIRYMLSIHPQLPQFAREVGVLPHPQNPALIKELDIDPLVVGYQDTVQSGWYNTDTGELAPGFVVTVDDTVLDLGCGPGLSTLFALDRGAKTTYADIDANTIEKIKTKLNEQQSELATGMVTNANPLPLNDGGMSKIISTEVLEHVDDPAQVMRELVRVGQSGAMYLIAVPADRGENIQKSVAHASYFKHPNHVRIFDKETFVDLIEESGLVVESYYAYGFFWTMLMIFYWASLEKDESTNDVPSALVKQWAQTWQYLMEKDRSILLKAQLDKALPKSQVIIARKP